MENGVRPWYRRPVGIVFLILLLPIVAWVLWFLWELGTNLLLLRSGKGDPFAELQKREFASSIAKTFQKTEVSAEDLARIAVGDHPTLGNPDAKVTIVEFVDWDCPFCREVAPTVRAFMAANPDRVNFILRDYPIAELHPQAKAVAISARCVFELSDHETYWVYHDRLFATQGAHNPADLRRYVQDLGVDLSRYDGCLVNPIIAQQIDASIEVGKRAGVGVTPMFFFNGVAIPGAIDPTSFEIIVNAAETATTR